MINPTCGLTRNNAIHILGGSKFLVIARFICCRMGMFGAEALFAEGLSVADDAGSGVRLELVIFVL